MCRDLEARGKDAYSDKSFNFVLWAAPTGIAAHTISSQTLHALFCLPSSLSRSYQSQPQAAVTTLQRLQFGRCASTHDLHRFSSLV